MTLEIRELVIEARVVDDTPLGGQSAVSAGVTEDDLARWVEQVTRRVLEALHEERERQ